MYYVCHDTFLSTAIGKDQLWLEGDQCSVLLIKTIGRFNQTSSI